MTAVDKVTNFQKKWSRFLKENPFVLWYLSYFQLKSYIYYQNNRKTNYDKILHLDIQVVKQPWPLCLNVCLLWIWMYLHKLWSSSGKSIRPTLKEESQNPNISTLTKTARGRYKRLKLFIYHRCNTINLSRFTVDLSVETQFFSLSVAVFISSYLQCSPRDFFHSYHVQGK